MAICALFPAPLCRDSIALLSFTTRSRLQPSRAWLQAVNHSFPTQRPASLYTRATSTSDESGEGNQNAVQTTSTVDSRMVVMTRGRGSALDRFLARLHPYHRLFNLLSPLSAWLAPAKHELHLRMLSTAANYTVHASMRGMRKTDITVLVSDGCLFIEAERKQPTQRGSPQPTAFHTLSVPRSLPRLGDAAAPAEQSGMVESERRQSAMAAQPANAQLRDGETGSDRVESCVLLPADSDVTAMTARWVDGVLEVVIPREQREVSEAMKIEVL